MAANIDVVDERKDERLANVGAYEKHASQYLPKNAWDYYSSGATDMISLRANRAAFSGFEIQRRIGSGKAPNTTTTALGRTIRSPVCAAATAMQCLAHADGERGTVRAANRSGVIHVLSSLATNTIEQVAAAAPDANRWFQLYVYRDRVLTTKIIRRAEAAGFSAIVLTVDTPVLGRREADMRNRFSLPPHLSLGILKDAKEHAQGVKQSQGESGLAEFVRQYMDDSLQWSDVKWLTSITHLPVLLKGVITAEDAALTVEHGCAGIIVSNHGARQLDGVNATLEALPEIVAAVDGRVEVYLDGGVRSGADAFKAVALGARAVFVGRPMLWGLSHKGEDGAHNVLELLRDEFIEAMHIAGVSTVAEIGPHCLAARADRAVSPERVPVRLRSKL